MNKYTQHFHAACKRMDVIHELWFGSCFWWVSTRDDYWRCLTLVSGWQYFLQFYNDRVLYKTIVTTCLLLCLGDTIVSGMYMQFLTVDCPSPNFIPDIQDYGVIGGRRHILVVWHCYSTTPSVVWCSYFFWRRLGFARDSAVSIFLAQKY